MANEKSAWKVFDSSMKGSVSYNDFKNGFEICGAIHSDDLEQIWNTLDHEGLGSIEFERFEKGFYKWLESYGGNPMAHRSNLISQSNCEPLATVKPSANDEPPPSMPTSIRKPLAINLFKKPFNPSPNEQVGIRTRTLSSPANAYDKIQRYKGLAIEPSIVNQVKTPKNLDNRQVVLLEKKNMEQEILITELQKEIEDLVVQHAIELESQKQAMLRRNREENRRLMKDLEELRRTKSEAIAREQQALKKGKRDVERIKCRMEKILESERKAKCQIQNSLTYTRLQLEEQIEQRIKPKELKEHSSTILGEDFNEDPNDFERSTAEVKRLMKIANEVNKNAMMELENLRRRISITKSSTRSSAGSTCLLENKDIYDESSEPRSKSAFSQAAEDLITNVPSSNSKTRRKIQEAKVNQNTESCDVGCVTF
eukprot:CAMPEP_0185251284 /NCGR_PEP_ID=MMETSP1359-20130426/700_1 /TAXON_ID=552665 /ORGANISM="Bigelowiella longifila, Strain CCMP242" /LENGTH=425 /DNA_ID=CAMNT_0027833105 /DNA_START=154 /DNA_END=1432 /DNA_ORIENTATION=-